MSDTTLIGKPVAEPSSHSRRPVLCFERTAAGQAQLKEPALALSAQATRLLMLFEEPQTIDELRRITEETWLPTALIELERRKLIRRIDLARRIDPTARQNDPGAAAASRSLADMPARNPRDEAAVRLARQRAQARILFLQQIGRLSTMMIERIESCQSEAELQRLTPAFAELLATPPAPRSRQDRAA
ncbi:MAG: hypothetical protein Q4A16_00745 [Lautropia sp.]|nr:hypothetical protein [Lautropia sp.]